MSVQPTVSREAALAAASVPTLLMCLAHLTGDEQWLRAPYLPRRDVALFADPSGGLPEQVRETLLRIQNELFDVGADLCMPLCETYAYPPLRVQQPWIDDLEADCDRYLEQLEPLRSFILPGGSAGAAYLHVATTVVRRAERATWAALEHYGSEPGKTRGEGGVNPLTATYLNRLSDLLFVLARVANLPGGDILWQPGGGRVAAPKR